MKTTTAAPCLQAHSGECGIFFMISQQYRTEGRKRTSVFFCWKTCGRSGFLSHPGAMGCSDGKVACTKLVQNGKEWCRLVPRLFPDRPEALRSARIHCRQRVEIAVLCRQTSGCLRPQPREPAASVRFRNRTAPSRGSSRALISAKISICYRGVGPQLY